MKPFYFFFIVFFYFVLSVGAQSITRQFTFSAGEIIHHTSDLYDVISLPDASPLEGEAHAGLPQLPVRNISILLPEDAIATQITLSVQSQL